MRIGPLEIISIVIIITAITLMARIGRGKQNDTQQNRETPADISPRPNDRPGKIRNYLKRLGIAFVAAGIIFALAGISMFRWAVQGYIWAFAAMAIGFFILFLLRKQ